MYSQTFCVNRRELLADDVPLKVTLILWKSTNDAIMSWYVLSSASQTPSRFSFSRTLYLSKGDFAFNVCRRYQTLLI